MSDGPTPYAGSSGRWKRREGATYVDMFLLLISLLAAISSLEKMRALKV